MIGDLCATILYYLSANGDVSYSVMSAVSVGRLEEGKHTGGWDDKKEKY